MNFPDVEVQPHWLATLERAADVMPNCRWVCMALDADVEPETEKEVKECIRDALLPYITVDSWYIYAFGEGLQTAHEYRIAWLNHMVEQCQAMQE